MMSIKKTGKGFWKPQPEKKTGKGFWKPKPNKKKLWKSLQQPLSATNNDESSKSYEQEFSATNNDESSKSYEQEFSATNNDESSKSYEQELSNMKQKLNLFNEAVENFNNTNNSDVLVNTISELLPSELSNQLKESEDYVINSISAIKSFFPVPTGSCHEIIILFCNSLISQCNLRYSWLVYVIAFEKILEDFKNEFGSQFNLRDKEKDVLFWHPSFVELDFEKEAAKIINQKVSFNVSGSILSYAKTINVIDNIINTKLQYYKNLLENEKLIDRINPNYHSVSPRYAWFVDCTYIEHYGDGINKKTGNGLLMIEDCSSRRILGFKVLEKNETLTSTIVTEFVLDVIEKGKLETGILPEFIHSDKETYFLNLWYIENLWSKNVKPSFTGKLTPAGKLMYPHGNQAVERLNWTIKNNIKKKLAAQKIAVGSWQSASLNKIISFTEEIINEYNNHVHISLSLKGISAKDRKKYKVPNHIVPTEVTPNECYWAHISFCKFESASEKAFSNQIEIINERLKTIDVNNEDEVISVCTESILETEEIKTYLENYGTFKQDVSLSKINNAIKQALDFWFSQYIHILIWNPDYAIIQHFFKNTVKEVEGPTWNQVLTQEFVTLLFIKQQMNTLYQTGSYIRKISLAEILQIIYNLICDNILLLRKGQQADTQLLFNQAEKNLDVVLEAFKESDSKNDEWLNQYNKSLEELKNIISSKNQFKNKNKSSSKVVLTTPIIDNDLFDFILSNLEKEKKKQKNKNSIFCASRNKLILFILYFFSPSINKVLSITIQDLKNIFDESDSNNKNSKIEIFKEKVFTKYCKDPFNLKQDFDYVIQCFNEQNFKSIDSLVFTVSPKNYKWLSRTFLTNHINKKIQNNLKDNLQKNLYTTKGLRVNMAINLLASFKSVTMTEIYIKSIQNLIFSNIIYKDDNNIKWKDFENFINNLVNKSYTEDCTNSNIINIAWKLVDNYNIDEEEVLNFIKKINNLSQ